MGLLLLQIDAFTDKRFGGNPAAIVPLEAWLPEELMQSIALENNLSETAFMVREGADYRIRWFTPTVEVDLCGHATLAAAFAIFQIFDPARSEVTFQSRSGPLKVTRSGELLRLAFPRREAKRIEISEQVCAALGRRPQELHLAEMLMAVFSSEAEVRALTPDMKLTAQLPGDGTIVTAPGTSADFVSRYFVPAAGIDEDPVTGSAHCTLVPYWSKRLGKRQLHARQVSARGGELFCEDQGEIIEIAGKAVLYLRGEIEL